MQTAFIPESELRPDIVDIDSSERLGALLMTMRKDVITQMVTQTLGLVHLAFYSEAMMTVGRGALKKGQSMTPSEYRSRVDGNANSYSEHMINLGQQKFFAPIFVKASKPPQEESKVEAKPTKDVSRPKRSQSKTGKTLSLASTETRP